jgi:hypothetical protein
VAVGGTLGILIPPSVILVVYAISTEQNIAKLFMAAMVPGLLAALFYVLTIAVLARLRPALAPPGGGRRRGGAAAGAAERDPGAAHLRGGDRRHLRRVFTPTGKRGHRLHATLASGWRAAR